jgi:hypothetical protein
MTGPILLSAVIGASASLLIAYVFKSLYDVHAGRRKQSSSFNAREDEVWD